MSCGSFRHMGCPIRDPASICPSYCRQPQLHLTHTVSRAGLRIQSIEEIWNQSPRLASPMIHHPHLPKTNLPQTKTWPPQNPNSKPLASAGTMKNSSLYPASTTLSSTFALLHFSRHPLTSPVVLASTNTVSSPTHASAPSSPFPRATKLSSNNPSPFPPDSPS